MGSNPTSSAIFALQAMTSPSLSARLFKIGVGLTLVLTGLAVTALLFIPYTRAKETRSWTETPCRITESRIEEAHSGDLADLTYRVYIRFHYQAGGRDFDGSRVQRRTFAGEEDDLLSLKTPHASKAKDLVAKYPSGTDTKCWVNPADPADAVLEHQSTAAIYTLWWPMLFAVGGAGILWSAVRRGTAGAPLREDNVTEPPLSARSGLS